jgi:hypothetical protein
MVRVGTRSTEGRSAPRLLIGSWLVALLAGCQPTGPAPDSGAAGGAGGGAGGAGGGATFTYDGGPLPTSLATCEVIPAGPSFADAGADNSPDGGPLGGTPHTNPMEFSFGQVDLGGSATMSITYYCGMFDGSAGIGFVTQDPASSADFAIDFPAPVGWGNANGSLSWHATFRPASPGVKTLTVTAHSTVGVLETHLVGIGR